MYQTWQWPTQSTDTTYAQPSTAVAPTASTAAAAPAAAAAVAANTWPVQAAYGQYAVANTLQQQWAWAAQNQYAYAASLAAGQQGSTATGVYPGVWPGQAASAAVATTTDAKTAASTTVATATTVAASVAKTEASKEELVPKDSSEMEKLNQLRAQAQQWTSQQQTAAWGMQSGATTAATPAASLTATSAVAAPAATAATAAVAAGWPQTSWNQSTWPSGQWSNQTQWQQSWSQQGQAATASAATQGATQAKASEATATEKDAKDETKSVADSNDKQADSSTADLDKEEEEFDRQFHEWEKQFEAWKEQNKNHPDKEAFAQYEKQWKAWREQLLQRKEEMRKKRAEKAASATPQAQGQAAVTGSATTTSNIPGLDLQDDKSSITTSAPSTSMPVAASVAPTQQVPVPTPAAATVAADQSLMYQSQVRMPPAQPYMYMPPQQFMYPPTMGAPPPTATAPPPMMTPQPQPQPLPYQSQPPPMMGQAEHHASGMQHPSVGSGAGVPDMAPVKKPLLDTPPPPGGMLPMPPGGSRYDDRPGGPHQMNEGHPHDMMPPPGGRMEPYGGRDPHLMGMEEEPYEDEWGYGRGRGMDFRGRGRGRGGTGRGRGRGSRWGDEFDGRPPLEHELPGPRRFEPGMRPPDDFPERFRRPGLDPDAFNPEFSVLESTKFPPDPGMEKPPDMPFDEEFGPRGRQGPPFPERRFGEGPPPPFDERGPPPPDQLRDRPRLPREPFDDMYPPERFGDRFPPPDRFDPKRGYPPPDEFDKRLPPPPGGPGGPEGFDDKRFPPDESRPGDKQRFPPGPPPPPGMHPRDDGRFMDERFGPRDRPPFGPPPPPPFEGDFPPPPPPFGDERFPPFDEGFRGMDRFARMRGERFPGRPFGPERFPPPPGPGEPPFGPGFPPDERFRFPDDREFRGPDRGPPPPPPFRGGRFMEALRHNSIDYDNRPAAAVMGDEFNQKYDAFDPQFGSDIINYRDSCYMGYIPPPAEPIIFSQVDVQGFDYNHGKSPLVTSTIRGKKKDAKEEEKHSGRAFEYAQRRDRSPYRDRNYRDRDGDRPDHFRDSFRDRERERPRDRNRDRDRDDRSRDSDRERNRDRDRHRDRDKDDRKEREFERDRERSRDKDRDGPRRSRWEPRPESGGNAGRERSPDSSKKQNGERGKENLSNASDPAGQFPAVDLYSNSNDAIGEVADIKDLLYPPGRLTRPKQLVIILRGLPGSGKTHVARLIKDKEIEQGGCAPRILSLDDYFMVETEVTATDEETGKKVKKKEFQYEYEACMEEAYRASLLRSFKKTIDERFFPFIIVDAVHNEVKQFEPIWSYAKQRGFQVYIAEMDCIDPVICHKRNIHKRTLEDVAKLQERWEPKPRHFLGLDIRPLLQDVAIAEVEMEDSDAAQKNDDENDDSIDASMQFHVPSKWEKLEATEEKLDQLDGLRITKKKHSTMEDYLQLPDDYEDRQCEPGKKRVRWADLEERKEQDRLRAIGFVVGQTDWSKMTDPTHADRALTRTKYI